MSSNILSSAGKNIRGNSGNSGHQVQTYEMSEGILASAYVLHPFQALLPSFWNRGQRLKDQREGWSCSQSRIQRTKVEGRTYSIFKLRYLHDKSEVLILR